MGTRETNGNNGDRLHLRNKQPRTIRDMVRLQSPSLLLACLKHVKELQVHTNRVQNHNL